MSSSSSSSIAKLKELREQLASLQSLEPEIPERFLPEIDSENTNNHNNKVVDPSLLQQYKDIKNEYLRRKGQRSFLDHIVTSHGNSQDMLESIEAPSAEEWQELQQAKDQLLQKLVAESHQARTELLEFQTLHRNFVSQKDELEHLIHELETTTNKNHDDLMDEDDDDDVDANGDDDEALAHQEETVAALMEKKAKLEMELKDLKEEDMKLMKECGLKESALGRNMTSEELEKLRAENDKLEKTVAHYEEMTEFYDSMNQLTEEIRGVKIISVEPKETDDEAKPTTTSNDRIVLKLKLLNKYDLEINMDETNAAASKKDAANTGGVVSAKFTKGSVIRGPTIPGSDYAPVQFPVPTLDDLVHIAQQQNKHNLFAGQGSQASLRFVLREALHRLTTMQKRVIELTSLQLETTSMKIGSSYRNVNNGFGGEDQDVVCSFAVENDSISIVLRMTPDCPIVEGSVYIDQIQGGIGQDMAEEIKSDMNGRQFKSPVDLVRAFKEVIFDS